MRILAIDSSGLVAAVAVTEDGRLLAEYRTCCKKTHSQTLLPMLDAMLRAIDVPVSTLDYVAVAAGPGSFTGLRIGAATAKGLCFPTGIPIVPVPTVDAMAWQLCGEPGIICPMMDARRGQVYTGLYRCERDELQIVRRQCAVSAGEIISQINSIGERAVFLGDGVPVYLEQIREKTEVPYRISPLWKDRQSAASLASLAEKIISRGGAVRAEDFAPVYLRASQAEREAAEKKHLPPVMVTLMRPEDARQAAELERLTLGKEAWTERMLWEAAGRRDSVYVAAWMNGRYVGHAGAKVIMDEGDISNVCVAEDCRRNGIGKKLLNELMYRARDLGATSFTLEVRSSNRPAIGLYEKLGFKSEGKRPGFYSDPYDDAEIMWLGSL